MTSIAWVGLGSNQGDSATLLKRALQALDGLPRTGLDQASAAYRTPPWGVTDQPDFLNAVARLSTELAPEALLSALLEIESDLGRVREGHRWGPRPIDLDLLVFDHQVIDTPELSLPHPHLHERAFVLVPLHALAPELVIPGRGPVTGLLEHLSPEDRRAVRATDIELNDPLD